MEWKEVNTSQIRMKPRTAHRISERSGRPGKPPPPPPPKRARLRRRKSSSEETLEPPMTLRRRRGVSPQGPGPWPPPCPSPDGGSPPPSDPLPCPQGPFVSANRPRTRLPHPKNVLIGWEYRGSRNEKQWQAAMTFLCARHGPSRRPADRPAARGADSLSQGRGRRRDNHCRRHRLERERAAVAGGTAAFGRARRAGRQRSKGGAHRLADRADAHRDRQRQGRRRQVHR